MSGPVPDLFTLGVTTLSLVDAAPGLTDRLLLTESTNVHNLAHDPLRVLGASAFWVGGTRLPWKVGVRFLLVTAPAERWLGTGRWLLAFAAGHVGATLVTVSGIATASTRVGWARARHRQRRRRQLWVLRGRRSAHLPDPQAVAVGLGGHSHRLPVGHRGGRGDIH